MLEPSPQYLIGWGGHASTSATWPAVTEIVGGAAVWSLTFTAPTAYSYRAHLMQN